MLIVNMCAGVHGIYCFISTANQLFADLSNFLDLLLERISLFKHLRNCDCVQLVVFVAAAAAQVISRRKYPNLGLRLKLYYCSCYCVLTCSYVAAFICAPSSQYCFCIRLGHSKVLVRDRLLDICYYLFSCFWLVDQ